MVMTKFELRVSDGLKEWTEGYEKDVQDPESWGQGTIAKFNASLRPNERPRKLISVKVWATGTKPEHDWEKQNMYSLTDGDMIYDVHKCETCGITGRRYGLAENITRDPEFKAKVYARCDTAQKHLAKKAKEQ